MVESVDKIGRAEENCYDIPVSKKNIQGEYRGSFESFTLDNSTQVVDELLSCRMLCGIRSFEIRELVSDGTIVVAPSFADEMEMVVVTIGGGNPGDMGGGNPGD
jgi:hypothetical protein